MWLLNRRVFVPRQLGLEADPLSELLRTADKLRAGAWAAMATALLAAAIVVGLAQPANISIRPLSSTHSPWSSPPGASFITMRCGCRSRRRDDSGSAASNSSAAGASRRSPKTAATHLIAQNFIRQRSRLRWWMHQCLFWGCLSAAAITFPLVFGWIHFESAPGDQMTYVTYLFGFPVSSFALRTIMAWLLFHGLDFSAVLVLAGICSPCGAGCVTKAPSRWNLSRRFLPLVMLFAISVTGLALTASTMWLRGALYQFLAILHAITVIAALLYLPFGKFFHIFQRPAQLGVKLYQKAGEEDPGASARDAASASRSRMQIDDLQAVLPQLGFDYSLPGPAALAGTLSALQAKGARFAQLAGKGGSSHG